MPLANYTATVNATANSTLNVSATASVAINLTLLQNATGELEVLEYGTNPTNTSASSANGFAVLGLGTFVSVNASANISGNLSWWILNIYYSEGSLPSNIEESTIRIYYFNSTLGQWVLQNSTVDTANNRVWANLTHFSIYSAGGAEHVSTGGGGGGGGGGGATASKDPIVIEPTLSAQLVEAPKNQEIGVVYEGKSYLFKVKSFTGSIVTLNSLPDIATYNIANGLSMGFDLDQDGKFDIQISYSGAYSSKAMLVFYAVPKPQPITLLPPKPREIKQVPEENVSLEETVSAQELETPAPEPKVSVQLLSESPAIQTVSLSFIEENKLYLYIGGVVLVFVVVFIVMNAIFGRRGPTRTAKKEVKKAVKEVKR
ncbi:hypothetical protein KY363_06105 [Candidatus Woesearchaeota archaeon]|nr:hypothetical protein [Candidatus Woesearchaeota archaeon]